MSSVSIGDNSILGDTRWGGLFGIEADFIALDDVKAKENNTTRLVLI